MMQPIKSRVNHRWWKITVDFVEIILGVLLAATVATSLEYYRQVRNAQREYEKAKGIVQDIVLSFNRELKRESDRLELIAFKVEGNSAKADTNLKKIDKRRKTVSPTGTTDHRFNTE